MMQIKFTDEHGSHVHESVGSPYDASKPITCTACIGWLNKAADVWEAKFSKRDGHSPNFWDGYKRSWQ